MNITSSPTTSSRGGKIHCPRGTKPESVIGNHNGVVVMIEGTDGRTYRVELWPEDLRQIAEQSAEALETLPAPPQEVGV